MRTWKWIITASLLISLGAMAQQTTAPSENSAAAPQSAPQSIVSTPAPSAPAAPLAAPTTMDQVVDRAILREHALITFLTTRTPLVETYLQNLKLDPQMGPSPREDHYFFGRLDLSDSVDRQDYLSGDTSLQKSMLGGVSKLFKFQ